MKLWKKISLVILGLIALSQIPAIYHLYQTHNQHSMISDRDAAYNHAEHPSNGYQDIAGVIHAHSSVGGHSYGRFEDLKKAAADNELGFVIMTEHLGPDHDTYGKSLEGIHNGVLFLAGNEVAIEGGNRFLVVEGFPGLAEAARLPLKEFLEKVRTTKRLALITHPENGDMNNSADGFEAFSLHNSADDMNKAAFFADAIWSLPRYPALTFLRHFKRPDAALRQFDEISQKRRISLFSGTDAHANIGFQIGGDIENPGFELIIDPYEMTFGIVRTHILLEESEKLTKEAVLETIRTGRCFIGLDRLGTTRGFMFEAVAGDNRWIMGDEASFVDGMKLKSAAPHMARYVVFRNGERFYESGMTKGVELELKDAGVYRVELYRDDLGAPFESLPWIISNPVYIR